MPGCTASVGQAAQDIEEDLARRDPAGLAALLENGPIRNPARTASQFRQWSPTTIRPLTNPTGTNTSNAA